MKILQIFFTSTVRYSHLTLVNPKQAIFNSIPHTYFWLFLLSQMKTNCNPLAHPTWKCHHTNLWIAKLFHLTEGLLRSFRRWRLWREPVVGHRWQEPVVMCGNWDVRQAISQQVFRVTTFCINTCFQSFSTKRHCSVAQYTTLCWNSAHVATSRHCKPQHVHMRSSCSGAQTQY